MESKPQKEENDSNIVDLDPPEDFDYDSLKVDEQSPYMGQPSTKDQDEKVSEPVFKRTKIEGSQPKKDEKDVDEPTK